MITFVIKGRLPGTNEYTAANRTNKFVGARMKMEAQQLCLLYMVGTARKKRPYFDECTVNVKWYEKTARRDIDNIRFGIKFILDTLQQLKVIPNDNQKVIKSITDEFFVDKENPRIEVTLKEVSHE